MTKRTLPEQYRRGKAYFYESEFIVNKDVLIPRPETELLVEAVLELAKGRSGWPARILEIGTGSGNIAISLTKGLPSSRITTCDISRAALLLARENALLNGVSGRVGFVASDVFGGFAAERFDMVLSNPPYVAEWEFATLPEEVLSEPAAALDGGPDGLYFIRRIIEESPRHLKSGGYLVMEIGYDQSGAVRRILAGSKDMGLVEIRKDYSGIERILIARKNG